MHLETIRSLFRYNDWANLRMFDALASVPDAEFCGASPGGGPSLRDTVTHIVWSEWIWLQRWTGVTDLVFQPADFAHVPASLVFSPAAHPDQASLRERWQQVAHETAVFVSSLSAERLFETIDFRTPEGHVWRRILWRQLVHAVNHSSYHRGQVALLLRARGSTPKATDFIAFDE